VGDIDVEVELIAEVELMLSCAWNQASREELLSIIPE